MPSYDRMKLNELDEATSSWLEHLLEVIESLDVDAYVDLMAEDVELMLDNGAVVLHGHDEVRAALSEGWAKTAAILHHEVNAYGGDGHLVHESIVDFTATDGSRATSRSTAWIDRNDDGEMAAARIYGDPS